MATEKQIEANRLNAQKSTGPRTGQPQTPTELAWRSFFRARELEKLRKIRRQTAAAPPAKAAPTVPTPEPLPSQPPKDVPNRTYVVSADPPAPCADPGYQTAASPLAGNPAGS